MGTILKAFADSLIITIKESIKLMLVTFVSFFVIAVPLAYMSRALNVEPIVAGILIGIVVVIVILYIDYKKLHCFRKIFESRDKFAKELLKEKVKE